MCAKTQSQRPEPSGQSHRLVRSSHFKTRGLALFLGLTAWLGLMRAASGQPDAQRTTGAWLAARQVVPGSEAQATVVFVARIINRDTAALRSPGIHLHAPVRLPHQDITELDVEGSPERLTDRWGAPVLHYQRQELASGATLVGRWTAWATLSTTAGRCRPRTMSRSTATVSIP